jgi:tRNA G26 N,N-dimethylase Trm1
MWRFLFRLREKILILMSKNQRKDHMLLSYCQKIKKQVKKQKSKYDCAAVTSEMDYADPLYSPLSENKVISKAPDQPWHRLPCSCFV